MQTLTNVVMRARGLSHEQAVSVHVRTAVRAMATASCFRPGPPTPEQVAEFNETGFLKVDSAFPLDIVGRVVKSIDDVFVGHQETGVYPDEWYWRPETAKPDVTRHGTNFWKVGRRPVVICFGGFYSLSLQANRTVASLVLDGALSEYAARLMGWRGARLGNDSM